MAAPHMHIMQLFILVLVQVAWLATPSLCDSSPAPGELQNHDVALFLGNTQALHSITEFNHADIVNSANYFIPEDPKRFKASSVSFRFRGGTSKNSSGSFFSIPFCRQASDGNPCSFHGYKPIVEFRFRHGTERYFSLHARTNPHPPPSTQKIIQSMQEKLKAEVGGEVGFPSVMGTDNVDYDETCAEITDECFLSSHATYTTSHKGMSTGDFSGRFFLRASPSEGVWRFVLHSISPLTHNVTVDVVVLLLPPPTPFSSLWWLDTWLGSTLLAVLCLGCVMGFLLICKELSIQHAGGAQRQVPSVFAAPPDHWENNVACHLMQIELVLRAVFSGAAVRLWTLMRSLPQRLGHSSSESAPLYHHGDGEDRGRDSAVICTNGEEEEEGPTCRICRCAEPTSDLFSPCACNGSCRYVHHDCLERWRSMTTNPEHRLVCAECKSPYRLVRGDALGGSSRFGSYVIAPALRSLGQGLARAVLWSGFLLLAVQYLKYSFFLVTGRDPGVEWNLWSGYNIVLGVYVAIALKLNLAILQPVISSVRSDSEQLILLLVSLVTVEIPMSYVGGYILWVMFDRWNSAEVSYGLGIASTGAAYFIMGERLARLLESLSSVRETVAPRDEA